MRRMGITTLCVGLALVMGVVGATTASATSYSAAAWGGNNSGQLGNETTTSSDVPVGVSKLSEVTGIAAGAGHGLALLKNGHVMAWGENSFGQLGNETTTNSDVPVEVSKLSEVVAVSAGGGHSLALLKDGHVVAWGANHSGQLGNETTTNSDVPVEVSGLTEVTAIAAGGEHSLALLSGGTVKAWGNNRYGALGDGTHSGPEKCTRSFSPEVEATEEYGCSLVPVTSTGLSEVTAISAASEYSLALLTGGAVKSWGDNGEGQLGDGSTTGPELCPEDTIGVEFLEGEEIKLIIRTEHIPCDVTPAAVAELSEVTAISAGAGHALALLVGGTAKAWGSNGSGQLGDGSTVSSDLPVAVGGIEEVVGVSAGSGYSLSYGAPLPPPPAAPVVSGVSPGSGSTAGGTTVKITGEHLTGVTAVKFGPTPAAKFEVNSGTMITAVSPARRPGTVNVTVTDPEGTSSVTSADEFTYTPPGNIEFGKCVNVGAGKGKYKNSGCSELPAPGRFEWTPGFTKGGFASADATETVEKVVKPKKIEFDSVHGAKLVCRNESGKGEYLGAKEVANVVTKFTGCEFAGAKCSSVGAAEGEIVTDSREGALGWIEREGGEVGLDLVPAGEGSTFLDATCGAASVTIRGSAIAVAGAVDKMASSFTLKFKQKKGKQEPEEFEGEATEYLEMSISGGAFEQVGLGADVTLTSEEALEINTVV
ncbi:MAG: IPT/TIG domain-containing protein [Solirubrobacteraceae bacterium]